MSQYNDGTVTVQSGSQTVYGVYEATVTGTAGSFVSGDAVSFSLSGATGMVMSWSAGTLGFTVASTQQPGVSDVISAPAATGTLTHLTTEPEFLDNISPGHIFRPSYTGATFYEVGSINTKSKMMLASAYAGPSISGSAYTVTSSFTPGYSLTVPEAGDQQPVAVIGRAINQIDEELLTLSGSISTEEAWNYPSYETNWSNFGSGFVNGRYRKDANGLIRLEGLVSKSTGLGADDHIFYLPEGYRPATSHIFAANGQIASVGITTLEVRVYPTGGVAITSPVAGTGVSWLSLDGITLDLT